MPQAENRRRPQVKKIEPERRPEIGAEDQVMAMDADEFSAEPAPPQQASPRGHKAQLGRSHRLGRSGLA